MKKKFKVTIVIAILLFLGLGIYTFASPDDEPELLDGGKVQNVNGNNTKEKYNYNKKNSSLDEEIERKEEEVTGQVLEVPRNNVNNVVNNDEQQEVNPGPTAQEPAPDTTAPEVEVTYSSTVATKEGITVTITSNEKLQALEGWELSEDGLTLTRTFTENITETFHVEDEAGNVQDVAVVIENIDKVKPTITVNETSVGLNKVYSRIDVTLADNNALNFVKINEEVKKINLTGNEQVLTFEDIKEYLVEGENTIRVKDKAGNQYTLKFTLDTEAPKVTIKSSSVGTDGVYSLIDFKITDNVNLKEAVLNDSYTTNKDGASRSLNFANYGTRYVQGENTWVVYDEAGNSTTVTFIFDTVAPTVRIRYENAPTYEYVILRFIADEEIQAVDGYTLVQDNTILRKFVYENEAGEMTVTDLAGNKTTVQYNVVLPDVEPATITLPGVQGASAMEYRVERGQSVSLEEVLANVSDNYDGDSKLAPYKADLLIGTKEENVYNYDFSNGFDTSKTGRYNVYYKYTDKAGNVSEATLLIVITDKTPANINVSYSTKDWTNENVLVTLTSDEEMQPLDGWKLSNDKLTLTKEFDTNVDEKVVVKDLAGNTTEVQYSVENIDKELPVIAIKNTSKVENGIYRSIDLKLTDNIRVLKTIVNDTKELPRSEGKSKSQDFSGYGKWYKEGENKVVLYDAAGNTTTITFKLDTVAPSVNVTTSNDGKRTNEDVTVKIVANELMQDLDGWNKTDVEDHSEFTKVFAKNETGEVTLKDLAGNEVTTNYKVENIDKVIPKIKEGKLNYSTKEITQGSVTVTIEATKPLYTPTGWTMNGKAYAFKKTYTENTTETVTIKDLYGNTNTFEVVVDNIYPDAEAGAIIDGRSVAVEDLQEFLNTELPDNTPVEIKVLEDLDLDESLVLPENKIVTLDLGENDVNFEKYNGEEVYEFNIGYSIINHGTLNLIGGNITMDNENGNVDGTIVPVYFLNYGTMSIKDTVFDMHDDIVIGDNLNKITSIDGITAIDPEVLNLDTVWDEWDWIGTDGIVNKDGDIEEIKNCDIEVTYNAVRNMGGNLINIKSGKYLSYYDSAVANTIGYSGKVEGNLNIFGGKYRTYNDESYDGFEAVNGANIYYKNTSVPGKLKLNSSTNFYEVVEK